MSDEISVYVIFVEEGPAYDAVSQMSAESWGYNVEPPALPHYLLENAVALLRRPSAGEAPPEGDLLNLDNEDPSVHRGLLVRFMRFSPEVDRVEEMLGAFRRALVKDISEPALQALNTLRRRGCRVPRAALEYKASRAHKRRPWAGAGRYRYLLPVLFPEDRDIVEALGTSIRALNASQPDEKQRVRVYSAEMIWNLSAVVTIQTAWRAYATRRRWRQTMLQELLKQRAVKFIRDWVGWQVFNKRLVLCKAIREVCAFRSPERDVFMTSEIRAAVEAYMVRQPPRLAREQHIQFTIDHEGRVAVVADPRQVRQGLPRWTGLELPVLTLEEVERRGLPPPFPLGDISPLLLHGGSLEDVFYRPDKPRPSLAPEIRVRYVSAEEALHRICLLLTLTWHLHDRRGIRLMQIPSTVQLLLQAIHPDAPPAQMLRLTEIYRSEEARIKEFVNTNFGTSSVRPFLEDLLLNGARQKLRQEEAKCYREDPGGLIGVPPMDLVTVGYDRRPQPVRGDALLLDTILERKRKGTFLLTEEGSRSLGAARAAPPFPQSTYFQPLGHPATLAPQPLIRSADGLPAEDSLVLRPAPAPLDAKGWAGPREARVELLMTRMDGAHDVRSARAEWETLLHRARARDLAARRRAVIAVMERPRLHPRSLNTDQRLHIPMPPMKTAENAAVVAELRLAHVESARRAVERERAAHRARIESIREEREAERYEVHDLRAERKERNERLAATTKEVDMSVRATQAQAMREAVALRKGRASGRLASTQVIRRLTSVAGLLVRQQRQQERENRLENNIESVRLLREAALQGREATKEARDERRDVNRSRREQDHFLNQRTIDQQRTQSARTKAGAAHSVRTEDRQRSAMVPPAGGTVGSTMARQLHIGKKIAHLSTVTSAAEVQERRLASKAAAGGGAYASAGGSSASAFQNFQDMSKNDLRGWSPEHNAARLSTGSTMLHEYSAAAVGSFGEGAIDNARTSGGSRSPVGAWRSSGGGYDGRSSGHLQARGPLLPAVSLIGQVQTGPEVHGHESLSATQSGAGAEPGHGRVSASSRSRPTSSGTRPEPGRPPPGPGPRPGPAGQIRILMGS